MSLPSLGAWIETALVIILWNTSASRSLHWERGLKRLDTLSVVRAI